MRLLYRANLLLPGLLLTLCVAGNASAADARDPWEGINRKVFAFNEFADRMVLKPAAIGYQAITPDAVDRSVTHFFNNIADLTHAANFALQGEGGLAADSSLRFLVNSSLGVGGLLDVASPGGIPRRDTGFGSTLGKWGATSGPYLILPFLGPSTVRDAAGIPVDWTFDLLQEPHTLIERERARYALTVLQLVDLRADLMRYEPAIVGDRYTFLREVYLQGRDFDVQGGQSPAADPFLDDDFSDDAVAPE